MIHRDPILILLVGVSSALCWWPVIMQPNLDLPFWWFPLTLVVLLTDLSSVLSASGVMRFTIVAAGGSLIGMLSGFLIWWPTDRIDASFVPIVIATGTLASLVLSLLTLAMIRMTLSLSNEGQHRTIWVALMCCAAIGPVTIVLTPPLVAHREARNDRIAASRLAALSNAVEQMIAVTQDGRNVCDGSALKRYYSGPAFSDSDWKHIAGNFVRRDGYDFSVFCHEKKGYTIDARPERAVGDGTREFCTDESGTVGCGMKWNGSRRECLPCTK